MWAPLPHPSGASYNSTGRRSIPARMYGLDSRGGCLAYHPSATALGCQRGATAATSSLPFCTRRCVALSEAFNARLLAAGGTSLFLMLGASVSCRPVFIMIAGPPCVLAATHVVARPLRLAWDKCDLGFGLCDLGFNKVFPPRMFLCRMGYDEGDLSPLCQSCHERSSHETEIAAGPFLYL
jgi:hypothetical protein